VIPPALVLLLSAAAPPDSPLPEAAPLSFEARADRARVRLGEPFAYEVTIRHRPEEWYRLPAGPALNPFQAEGVSCRRDPARAEVHTICSMRLALFALGPVDVPDLVFLVDGPTGKSRLEVPGPRITGLGILDPSLPPASISLRDIAPPVPLFVPSVRLAFLAVSVLAVLWLAAAARRVLARRRAGRGAVGEPSPAERFASRLEELEVERLPQRGLCEDHLTRLSEAVREYLGALSALPALDLTSGELLAALGEARDPRLDLRGLELLLVGADLVKFARARATPEACRDGTEYAQSLLGRTRQSPEGTGGLP